VPLQGWEVDGYLAERRDTLHNKASANDYLQSVLLLQMTLNNKKIMYIFLNEGTKR
jgi:hypothetical protein